MSGFLCSMVGVSPAAAAVANAAVLFDGTDDYYSATGITSTATDGFYATVAITFYYDGSNGDYEGMLNLRLGAADSNWGLVVGLSGGTKVRLSRVKNSGSDGGEMYLDSVGDTALVTNGWNQVVFWHKGDNATASTSKCWVNGVAQTVFFGGTMTNTTFAYNWGHTTGQVWIGRHTTDMIGGAQPYFKGRYSQIYIHNGQTSAPSISSFWNTTSNLPLDLGTNGTGTGLAQPLIYHYGDTTTFPTNNGTGFSSYTLTQSGGVVSAAGPTYGIKLPTGVEFQRSSGERIRVASLGSLPSNSKAWVASAWYKPASLVTSGTHAIFGTTQTLDGNSPIGFEITGSSTINGYAHYVSGAASNDATFTPGFTVGTWYHIVFRMNGTNSGRTQCWVNGVRYLDIAADNYAANLPHTNTGDFGMGARSMSTLYTAHCVDGCLAQVWVYAADYDIETNITKFYNNGLVDFGSAGTSSGLPTPHFYHKGSTQATFDDINGSVTGTATVTGTLSTCS